MPENICAECGMPLENEAVKGLRHGDWFCERHLYQLLGFEYTPSKPVKFEGLSLELEQTARRTT